MREETSVLGIFLSSTCKSSLNVVCEWKPFISILATIIVAIIIIFLSDFVDTRYRFDFFPGEKNFIGSMISNQSHHQEVRLS